MIKLPQIFDDNKTYPILVPVGGYNKIVEMSGRAVNAYNRLVRTGVVTNHRSASASDKLPNLSHLFDTPIKRIAVSNGIYDSISDPYDKLKNGDQYSSVMPDLERFAKLIIGECIGIILKEQKEGAERHSEYGLALYEVYKEIKDHFGVEL